MWFRKPKLREYDYGMFAAAGDIRILEAATFLSLPASGVQLSAADTDKLQDSLNAVISDHRICPDGLQALLRWHERQGGGYDDSAPKYNFWELVTLHGVDENE